MLNLNLKIPFICRSVFLVENKKGISAMKFNAIESRQLVEKQV